MGYFCHRNSLKLHMMQKLFSTISNVRAITQKLCSPDDGSSKRQAPIDQSPRHRHTFPPPGFLHWRLSDDGPGASRIVPGGRHPEPLYGAIIVKLDRRSFPSPRSTQVAIISSSRPSFDWPPRAVTVKGGRRPSRSGLPLTVTSTAAGEI